MSSLPPRSFLFLLFTLLLSLNTPVLVASPISLPAEKRHSVQPRGNHSGIGSAAINGHEVGNGRSIPEPISSPEKRYIIDPRGRSSTIGLTTETEIGNGIIVIEKGTIVGNGKTITTRANGNWAGNGNLGPETYEEVEEWRSGVGDGRVKMENDLGGEKRGVQFGNGRSGVDWLTRRGIKVGNGRAGSTFVENGKREMGEVEERGVEAGNAGRPRVKTGASVRGIEVGNPVKPRVKTNVGVRGVEVGNPGKPKQMDVVRHWGVANGVAETLG